MGFGQDAEKIAAETRWRKQTLLFSATLEGELLVDFAERLLNDPVKIDAEPSRRERKKINQDVYKRQIYCFQGYKSIELRGQCLIC